MASKPKVLVVGDNDLAGLTTVRSLGRAGMVVHLIATEDAPITRRSRYVQRFTCLGSPLVDPAGFCQRLLHLVQSEGFDLVIPIADKALVPLMECREEIEHHAPLAAPDRAAFDIAHRKERTLELARELGVPTPRGWLLHEPAELDRIETPLPLPIVLKPTTSVQANRTQRNEVRIAQTETELRQRLPGMLRKCPVLLQEFCPGYGVGIGVLADRGELVAAFQHERVHEPPQGGASSYRKSVPLSSDLLEHTRAMFRALRWTGPAMVEFKLDPATGRAVLMEINGRLWGSLGLAVQAGVDFPRLMVDLFVRKQVTPVFTYRAPYFVRHTPRDVFWFWANLRTPKNRPDLLRKSFGEVLAECGNVLRLREGYDLESLTDPMPAVAAWAGFVREAIAGVRQRLGRAWCNRLAQASATRVRQRHPALQRRLAQARSVLFVCQGNVNRSAVAEAELRRLTADSGLRISSAGLLGETGRHPSPVSATVAAEFGIDLEPHRSTGLTAELLDQADMIVVMERAHLQGVRQLNPRVLDRCVLLAAFQDAAPLDIPDPHGHDPATFRAVYQTVLASTAGLAQRLGRVAEPAASVVA